MPTLQLRRSTALADLGARARHAAERAETPVVHVGGLGMQIVRAPRTYVGSAYDVASRLFVRAGADWMPPAGPPGYLSPPADAPTVCPTVEQQAKMVDDAKHGVMSIEMATAAANKLQSLNCLTQAAELRAAAGIKPVEVVMTKPAPTTTTPTTTPTTTAPMPKQSVLGKVATVAIVAPFVAGPPVIGYLLFGWIGAGVGAVVAAPLALGLVAYTVMG